MEPLVGRLSARFAGLRVTDRRTHRDTDTWTHGTTAVTLAAHARRALMKKSAKPGTGYANSDTTPPGKLCNGKAVCVQLARKLLELTL